MTKAVSMGPITAATRARQVEEAGRSGRVEGLDPAAEDAADTASAAPGRRPRGPARADPRRGNE